MGLGKNQIHALQVLRKMARFRNARFALPGGYISNDKDTKAIKEATERYIESWVIPIIDAIETNDRRYLNNWLLDESGDKVGTNFNGEVI